MQTGLAAMQAAVAQSTDKAASVGTGFADSLSYHRWKVGERKLIRFVHSYAHLITANFYNSVICGDMKARSIMINPALGDLVTKYRNGVIGMARKYKSDEVEEPKKRMQSVAIAVLREERPISLPPGVTELDGYQYEILDFTFYKEVEVNGQIQKFGARSFGIVQQSESNFWSQVEAIIRRYGDMNTYDLEVNRTGEKEYSIQPVLAAAGRGPRIDPRMSDSAFVEAYYGYGRQWNENDPERYMYCPKTLAAWSEYFSGEAYIGKLLMPKEGSQAVATAAAAPPFGQSAGPPPDWARPQVPQQPAPPPTGFPPVPTPPGFAPTPQAVAPPGFPPAPQPPSVPQPPTPPGFPPASTNGPTPATVSAAFGNSGYGEFSPATTHNPGPTYSVAPPAPPGAPAPYSSAPPPPPIAAPPVTSPVAPAPVTDEAQAAHPGNTQYGNLMERVEQFVAQQSQPQQQ